MKNELYHSDIYLGQDFSDGVKHWKYIKREKKNGRWVYYYKNDKLDKLYSKKLDALNNAMRESSKYKEIGTRYSYGKNKDTIHYKIERKDYSDKKADAAWKKYNKAKGKYNKEKLIDIPSSVVGTAAAGAANVVSNTGYKAKKAKKKIDKILKKYKKKK